MIILNGTVLGGTSALAALARIPGQVDQAVAAGMKVGIVQGQSIVRGKASGRPGPRVITGNFRRSITGDTSAGAGIIRGQIGSNAPQAARLEFGFVGRDVLGRNYNQPPFPYLQPSVPEVQAAVSQAISAAISERF